MENVDINGHSATASNSEEETIYMSLESFKKNERVNKFRPVIIDGCNIGFHYGQVNDNFSAEGLQIAYEYFKEIGYEDFQNVKNILGKHVEYSTTTCGKI